MKRWHTFNTLKVPLFALLLTFYAFLSGQAFAEPVPISVAKTLDRTNVTLNLEWVAGSKTQMDFDPIRAGEFDKDFQKADKKTLLNLKGKYWFRGSFDNPSSSEVIVHTQFDRGTFIKMLFLPGDRDADGQKFVLGWGSPFGEREIPYLAPTVELRLPPGKSSFIVQSEGSRFEMIVGSKTVINKANQFYEAGILVAWSIVLALAIYNIFLFSRTQDKAYLYYSLRCFFSLSVCAIDHNLLLKYILPESTLEGERFMALFISLGLTFWILATRRFLSLDQFINKKFLTWSFYLTVGLVLFAGILPWVNRSVTPLALVNMLGSLSFVWTQSMAIYLCFKRYRPAYFYLLAATAYFAGVMITVLSLHGVLPANIITSMAVQLGGSMEALLMSLGLGDKYMTAMKASNTILNQRNVELDRDLSNMLRSLDQGIFSINPEGKISPEFSDYLKKILDTDKIANEDPFEILFRETDLSQDKKDQMKETVLISIGGDDLSFGANSHLLPREIKRQNSKGLQTLEIDWIPLFSGDDVCEKMMVVLRDVSTLRAMQLKTEKTQRDLQIVGQVLAISPANFERFSKDTVKLIDQSRIEIENFEHSSTIDIRPIFRRIHTIKGNARTYGLVYIAEVAHELENYLAELKSDQNPKPDAKRLMDGMLRLQAVQEDYIEIVSNRLGSNRNASQDDLLDNLNGLYKELKDELEIERRFLRLARQKRLERFFPTLEEVLAPTVRNLNKTAEQLLKPMPYIAYEGVPLRLKNEMDSMSISLFTQILGNSLDHGIELPEERKKLGKDPRGKIIIESSVTAHEIVIVVSDDGAGLNLAALASRSVQPGPKSDDQIGNEIFIPGVSTAATLTQISGRGMGMDIVKNYILEAHGSISIAFTGLKTESGRRPFKFVITLPISCLQAENLSLAA